MRKAMSGSDSELASTLPNSAHCFHQDFAPQQLAAVSFDRDYLMFATSGSIRLAIDGRQWALPPAFAALIPANTQIDVDIPHQTTCCSVLFEPGLIAHFPRHLVVFNVPDLLRAMIQHSRRWPENRSTDDVSDDFFKSIGNLAVECAQNASDIWHPLPESKAIGRAIAFTEAHLAEPLTLEQVATIARMSERTFLRKFTTELGMTWLHCLRRLRIGRAVELLSTTPDSIAQIALAVGYNSLSAFNAAFRDITGTTPAHFRNSQRNI